MSGFFGERSFQIRREEREADEYGEREREDEGVFKTAFDIENPKERAGRDDRSNLPYEGVVFRDRSAFAKQPDGHAREIRDPRGRAESDDDVFVSVGNGFVDSRESETRTENEGEGCYWKTSHSF